MEKSDLRKEFNKIFKVEPEYYIDTGGRFEICGNHTDHNHGLCLVANCSLRIKACVNKNANKVRIKSQGYSFFEFSIGGLEFDSKELNKTLLLAKGILFKLKEQGYKITMFYVALDDVAQNTNHIAMKVKNGGHDIPIEDIVRRSKTSFD